MIRFDFRVIGLLTGVYSKDDCHYSQFTQNSIFTCDHLFRSRTTGTTSPNRYFTDPKAVTQPTQTASGTALANHTFLKFEHSRDTDTEHFFLLNFERNRERGRQKSGKYENNRRTRTVKLVRRLVYDKFVYNRFTNESVNGLPPVLPYV